LDSSANDDTLRVESCSIKLIARRNAAAATEQQSVKKDRKGNQQFTIVVNINGDEVESGTSRSGRKRFSITQGITRILTTLLIVSPVCAFIYGHETQNYMILKNIAETGAKILVEVAVEMDKA
jgi:hypothetical protein